MKRINEYKKLFGVENEVELKTLKKSYRDLVKEWHPDKFQNNDALQEKAKINSRKIIDDYHFLVSITPKTIAANLEDYTKTITNSNIADFSHKKLLLKITFQDNSTYKYF